MGKNVGSDVVSCVEETGRSTRNVEGGTRNRRLERTGPCKKQGLTPDFAEERGESKNPIECVWTAAIAMSPSLKAGSSASSSSFALFVSFVVK